MELFNGAADVAIKNLKGFRDGHEFTDAGAKVTFEAAIQAAHGFWGELGVTVSEVRSVKEAILCGQLRVANGALKHYLSCLCRNERHIYRNFHADATSNARIQKGPLLMRFFVLFKFIAGMVDLVPICFFHYLHLTILLVVLK